MLNLVYEVYFCRPFYSVMIFFKKKVHLVKTDVRFIQTDVRFIKMGVRFIKTDARFIKKDVHLASITPLRQASGGELLLH